MRLGELVWPDKKDLQNYRKVSTRDRVLCFPDSYEFFLPGHKADALFEGSRIVVQRSHTPTDPLQPFRHYLQSRDTLFPFHSSLWIRENGNIPTRSWFIRRLRLYFPSDISGHSMRAGGATSLAMAGVAPDVIQRMGRWSSDSWQAYIRKNPVILQAFIFGGRNIHDGPLPNQN